MNYETMTIETLSDSVFRQSEFKVNKADLAERITYLIEKDRIEQLAIQGVRHPLPTKQEAEIELSTMLAEIEKNTKESYLKRTILKGIEIGFKKGYNYMKGNCA